MVTDFTYEFKPRNNKSNYLIFSSKCIEQFGDLQFIKSCQTTTKFLFCSFFLKFSIFLFMCVESWHDSLDISPSPQYTCQVCSSKLVKRKVTDHSKIKLFCRVCPVTSSALSWLQYGKTHKKISVFLVVEPLRSGNPLFIP